MTGLTKEKIMDVALELFVARGIRDVSIDEVCHELGISKKTFYVFYAKKEDLVRDTVSFQMGKRHDMMVAYMGARNPVQVLKMLPCMIDEYSMLESNYLRAAYDLRKYYPKTFETVMSDNLKASRKSMGEFIDWGIREGFFQGRHRQRLMSGDYFLYIQWIQLIRLRFEFLEEEEAVNYGSRENHR